MTRSLTLAGIGAVGTGAFGMVAAGTRAELPASPLTVSGAGAALLLAGLALWVIDAHNQRRSLESLGVAVLASTLLTLVWIVLYELSAYLPFPADLLTSAESPFVNDILKVRIGVPIYTEPMDNNSYPHTPGTQLLTYALAAIMGQADSIFAYRTIQFSFVIAAAWVGAFTARALAEWLLGNRHFGPVWTTVAFFLLLLVARDPLVNPYTHSLHSDGLALLMSAVAFWVLARYAIDRKPWHMVAMVLLPAAGFMVNQGLVVWAGLFVVYLVLMHRRVQEPMIVAVGSASALVATLGFCFVLWGDHFVWWILAGIGAKQISVARSVLHVGHAGMYAAIGLWAALLVWRPSADAKARTLWIVWVLLFLMGGWSSGGGYVANHLGPGAFIATVWFTVMLVRAWPRAGRSRIVLPDSVQQGLAVVAVLLFMGGLGFIRDFRNPVPREVTHYIDRIEAEFAGLDPARVLLDNGTWVYLRLGVLMTDRSSSVSLHIGANSPINHVMLQATIQRIQDRCYDKILAHELITGGTAYDYQDRGSGVQAAILEHYEVVRTIEGVEARRWPKHLITDVQVLVPGPTNNRDRIPTSCRSDNGA